MDLKRAKAIAAAYDAAPVVTSDARDAYIVLSRYVRERFAQLHADGWRVYPTRDDAPPDLQLVRESRVLPVYDLAHGHPAFPDGVNYMFRAVHDVYGHLATDPWAPFGLVGEVIAFETQARDLAEWTSRTPYWNGSSGGGLNWLRRAIQSALWTEIVGQAAYHAARGRFPVQKAALLDPEAFA